MTSEVFQRWQHAEHDARDACTELLAMLQVPDRIPPDDAFERVRRLRSRAIDALQQLISSYMQDVEDIAQADAAAAECAFSQPDRCRP